MRDVFSQQAGIFHSAHADQRANRLERLIGAALRKKVNAAQQPSAMQQTDMFEIFIYAHIFC